MEFTLAHAALCLAAAGLGAIVTAFFAYRHLVRKTLEAANRAKGRAQIWAQIRAQHLIQQIDTLTQDKDRLEQANATLNQRVRALTTTCANEAYRARQHAGALREAFARNRKLEQLVGRIRHGMTEAMAERRGLESELEAAREDAGAAQRALVLRDDKIDRLKGEVDNWRSRLPPLIERYRERDREAQALTQALEESRTNGASNGSSGPHIRKQRIAPDAFRDANGQAAAPGETPGPLVDTIARRAANGVVPVQIRKDDLKRIRGVGPAIEKTLNEIGIFRFNQLAQISEHDIDRVARRFRGFRRRIEREDWIGQARDLDGQNCV